MSMMYLLTFNGPPGMREDLTKFLDSREEITDWHSSMVNSVIIVTELDVVALRDLLKLGPARRFLIVEIKPDAFNQTISGWLPRATWEFMGRRQTARQ